MRSVAVRGFVFVASLVALAGCAREGVNEAQRLESIFASAAAEWDVPQPLLEGIGFIESRWSMRDGKPAADHGFGIMHLVDGGPDAPLQRAAKVLGVPPERVRTDARTNVRAAALLLREDADRYFRETPLKSEKDLAAWWQVVMRWSGARDPGVADEYATFVYRAIGRGEGAQLDDGSHFEMRALAVETGHEKLFGVMEFAITGNYPTATWREADKYTSGRDTYAKADRVVIHTAQGSYSGTISWFQNPQVQASAHYVVSAGGAVTAMVKDADTAWHAGDWDMNLRSIGIEHEGFVDRAGWATDAMYEASANLTRWLCDTYGIPKDRQHVIAHYEVPGCNSGRGGGHNCHTDPCFFERDSAGQWQMRCLWSWDRYMTLVGGSTGPQTGTLRGFVFSSEGGAAPSGNTAPVAGARVTVTESGATAITGDNGAFSFALPPGVYHPKASAPGFADGTPYAGVDCDGSGAGTDKSCREVTAGQTTYSSFVLQPVPHGRVKGFVYAVNWRDATDRSLRIGGAQISVGSSLASAGEDGTFTITVPAGPQVVQASKAGYRTASESVNVPNGAERTVEIGLRPGGEDEAKPVITFTKPAAGAQLSTATAVLEGTLSEAVIGLQVTDEFGSRDGAVTPDLKFLATVKLKAGVNTIHAIAADESGNVGEARLELTYQAEGVSGAVRDAVSGAPVSNAVLSVGEAFAKTGTDGRYAIDLPAGTHALSVQVAGYVARTVHVAVAAASRTRRDVSLLPADSSAALSITTPSANSVLAETPTLVTGKVALAGLAGVTVNGLAAEVENGGFTANVPLVEGANTIMANATTDDGLEVTASVAITFDAGCGCATTSLGPVALAGLALLRRRRVR